MIVAAIADVHAHNHRWQGGAMEGGINNRCRLVTRALKGAVAAAKKQKAEVLLVLGDLVDVAKPSPQVLFAVGNALMGIRTCVLKGNHDNVSDTIGDHALSPLAWTSAEVVEIAQGRDDEFGLIPFQAGMSSTWLPEAWRRAVGPHTRVVGMHLGIADDATPHFLTRAPDATTIDALAHLASGTKVKFVLAGNWHKHEHWHVKPHHTGVDFHVIQCGTFAPAGFDDALPFEEKAYGMIHFVDTERGSWWSQEIPGPRFEKVVWEDGGEKRVLHICEHAKQYGHSIFVQVRAEPRSVAKAREYMAGAGILAGYQVLPETTQLHTQAKHAAESTRSAESLRAGVRRFVKTMALEEGVSRDDVQARVLAYLKG